MYDDRNEKTELSFVNSVGVGVSDSKLPIIIKIIHVVWRIMLSKLSPHPREDGVIFDGKTAIYRFGCL